MKVLIIAPHPDDESIGCGGTLCLHGGRGDSMAAVYLTSGELGLKHLPREQARLTREREAEKAARMLGREDELPTEEFLALNRLKDRVRILRSVARQEMFRRGEELEQWYGLVE